MSVRLFVNIDHVATVRNARGTRYPDPVHAAEVCLSAGADGITAHLREDRRHIVDDDVARLRACLSAPLNLECAATDEMRGIVARIAPETATLVPERREERTTEGGLDVVGQRVAIEKFVSACREVGTRVSLFIPPDERSVRASAELGVEQIELHTGEYCHLDAPKHRHERSAELDRLHKAAALAHALGLEVAAGHGLTRHNLGPIAKLPHLAEVSIGHALVGDALFVGLPQAVRDMRAALERGREAH
jgi:pyridoxine 5-phosphate synthase